MQLTIEKHLISRLSVNYLVLSIFQILQGFCCNFMTPGKLTDENILILTISRT